MPTLISFIARLLYSLHQPLNRNFIHHAQNFIAFCSCLYAVYPADPSLSCLSFAIICTLYSIFTDSITVGAVDGSDATPLLLFTSPVPPSDGEIYLFMADILSDVSFLMNLFAPGQKESRSIEVLRKSPPWEISTFQVTTCPFSPSSITWIVGAWGYFTFRTITTHKATLQNTARRVPFFSWHFFPLWLVNLLLAFQHIQLDVCHQCMELAERFRCNIAQSFVYWFSVVMCFLYSCSASSLTSSATGLFRLILSMPLGSTPFFAITKPQISLCVFCETCRDKHSLKVPSSSWESACTPSLYGRLNHVFQSHISIVSVCSPHQPGLHT